MLNNIPQVTKNIIIINVLLFLATMMFQNKIDLISVLGAYPFNSPKFESYQIVTHFFMHAGFMHIAFNMFGVYIFGSHLERIWGPKRFFFFYILSALGAYLLYAGIDTYQTFQLKNEIVRLYGNESYANIHLIVNDFVTSGQSNIAGTPIEYNYANKLAADFLTPMVGASGALFGVLAAFAMLFPNTELYLMFIPFPVKAKYLIGGYFILEVFLGFGKFQGDSVAHFAHVGGAIVGFILVKIWQRNKTTFY